MVKFDHQKKTNNETSNPKNLIIKVNDYMDVACDL